MITVHVHKGYTLKQKATEHYWVKNRMQNLVLYKSRFPVSKEITAPSPAALPGLLKVSKLSFLLSEVAGSSPDPARHNYYTHLSLQFGPFFPRGRPSAARWMTNRADVSPLLPRLRPLPSAPSPSQDGGDSYLFYWPREALLSRAA